MISFTYVIEKKGENNDISRSQTAVFYFSYKVSTLACNATRTLLKESKFIRNTLATWAWDTCAINEPQNIFLLANVSIGNKLTFFYCWHNVSHWICASRYVRDTYCSRQLPV